MGLNSVNLQALIISSLAAADSTALEQLQAKVPLFWQLHARVAVPEIRYWYCRRDACFLLMGCVNKQIDYQRRIANGSRNSLETSAQDSTMAAVSEEVSTSQADRSSSSSYDAETNSSGSGSNSASRSSSQSAESDSSYDDTGEGSSTQNRRMHQATSTKERGKVEDVSTVDMVLQRLRTGNGSHVLNETIITKYKDIVVQVEDPSGTPYTLTLPYPLGMEQETSTNSLSTVQNEVNEHVYASFPGTAGDLTPPADPYRHTHQVTNVLVQPYRSIDMDMYDRPVADAGAATPSSFSTFTADVSGTDTASSESAMTASSQAQSESSMTGAGAGSSESEGTSESVMTATASRNGSGSGTANRSMQAQSQADSIMERLHQRFLHLQQLWENCTEMIEMLESKRLAVSPYVVALLTVQYPDGWDAVSANAYLVKQPLVQ